MERDAAGKIPMLASAGGALYVGGSLQGSGQRSRGKVHPREGTEMATPLPPLCTVREAAGACESRPRPCLLSLGFPICKMGITHSTYP